MTPSGDNGSTTPPASAKSDAGRKVRFGLKFRLVYAASIVVTFVVATQGALLAHFAPRLAPGVFSRSLESLASEVSNASADPAVVEDVLERTLVDRSHWRHLVVFDPAGAVLASALQPGAPRAPMDRVLIFGRSNDRSVLQDWMETNQVELVERPLVDRTGPDPVPKGSLALFRERGASEAAADRLVQRLRVTCLLVGAVASLLAAWSCRNLRRTLRGLLEAVARIGAGDLDARVGSKDRTEVGRVAREFDSMAERLSANRLALERRAEDLEDRVRRRRNELEQANRQLQEQDRLREAFLSSVSHELRTPLTAVRAAVHILREIGQDEAEESAREEFSEIVHLEIARLHALLRNFLDLAALDAEQVEGNEVGEDSERVEQQLTLAECVERAVSACVELACDRVRVGPDLATVDIRSPWRFVRALEELLRNALAHSSDPVEISAAESEVAWHVRVRDHGKGVAPEHREAVFDRFRQLGETLTAKESGTGLGLALCRAMVQSSGGFVEFVSIDGPGACVEVHWPKFPRAATRPGKEPACQVG